MALVVASLRRCFPGKATRAAGIVFVSLAVYLHPTASASALRLLNCRSVQLSATAVAALEDSSGDSASQDFSASTTLTMVSVVASNPYVKCWGSLHASAGGFAAASLVAFIALLPALTFYWLWFDARLVHDLRMSPAVPSRTRMLENRHLSRRSVVPSGDASGVVDPPSKDAEHGSTAPPSTPILFPFLGGSDYHPAAWFWRHVDLAVVFGLSAISALLPVPASLTEVGAKLAAILLLLGTLAVLLLALPNPYRQQWKRPVRLALIALSAACVTINAASRALDLGFGGPTLAASIDPGAYIIIGLTGVTLVTLITGFGYNVISTASNADRSRWASEAYRLNAESKAAQASGGVPVAASGGAIASDARTPESLALESRLPSADADVASVVLVVESPTALGAAQSVMGFSYAGTDSVSPVRASPALTISTLGRTGCPVAFDDVAARVCCDSPLGLTVTDADSDVPSPHLDRTRPPTKRELQRRQAASAKWQRQRRWSAPCHLALGDASGGSAPPSLASNVSASKTGVAWGGYVLDPFEGVSRPSVSNSGILAFATPQDATRRGGAGERGAIAGQSEQANAVDLASSQFISNRGPHVAHRGDPPLMGPRFGRRSSDSAVGRQALAWKDSRGTESHGLDVHATVIHESALLPGGAAEPDALQVAVATGMPSASVDRERASDLLSSHYIMSERPLASPVEHERITGPGDPGAPSGIIRGRRMSHSGVLGGRPMESPALLSPGNGAGIEQRRRSFLLTSAVASMQAPLGARSPV